MLFRLLLGGACVGLLVQVPAASGAWTSPAILAVISGYLGPYRLAVDSTTNRIYVASLAGIVQVIDGSTNAVIATLAGMPSSGVAVNNLTNCAYVSGDPIPVIDYDNTTPYSLPVSAGAIAVDPTRNMIYAATPSGLGVINGVTHTVTTIPLPFGYPGGSSVAVNEATNRVYVSDNDISANIQPAYVIVVDRNTNLISAIRISVPGAVYAYVEDIEVNPVTNRVYVSVSDQYGVSTVPRIIVFDGGDHSVRAEISTSLGRYGKTGPIIVNANTNRVHALVSIATPGGFPLASINGLTNTIESTFVMPSTHFPLGIAANTNTDRVYVTRVDALDRGSTAVIGEPGSASPPGPNLMPGRCRQPAFLQAIIDIKPGASPNTLPDLDPLNLSSNRLTPLAIFTTSTLNASTVDANSVRFAAAPPVRSSMEDVDSDADLDLVLHFDTQALDLTCASTEAALSGQAAGVPIQGTDTVRVLKDKNGVKCP